jgi:hypothetical protein
MKNLNLVLAFAALFSVISAPVLANNSQDEQQVGETLDRMGQAMVHKDVATLATVLHGDLTWGHSTGAIQTKEQLLKEVAGTEIYEVFKFSDFSIHLYGSTAVVRCTADIRNGAPPTKPMHEGRFNCLIVLVKGSQGWQIVGGQRAHVEEKSS